MTECEWLTQSTARPFAPQCLIWSSCWNVSVGRRQKGARWPIQTSADRHFFLCTDLEVGIPDEKVGKHPQNLSQPKPKTTTPICNLQQSVSACSTYAPACCKIQMRGQGPYMSLPGGTHFRAEPFRMRSLEAFKPGQGAHGAAGEAGRLAREDLNSVDICQQNEAPRAWQ